MNEFQKRENVLFPMSRALAEVASVDWDVSEWSHEDKVVSLRSLEHAYAAAVASGWDEHTSDWDWSFQIALRDGSRYGAYCGDESRDGCNTFGLAYESMERAHVKDTPESQFTACVDHAKVKYLWIEESGENAESGELESKIRYVMIDDLALVRLFDE